MACLVSGSLMTPFLHVSYNSNVTDTVGQVGGGYWRWYWYCCPNHEQKHTCQDMTWIWQTSTNHYIKRFVLLIKLLPKPWAQTYMSGKQCWSMHFPTGSCCNRTINLRCVRCGNCNPTESGSFLVKYHCIDNCTRKSVVIRCVRPADRKCPGWCISSLSQLPVPVARNFWKTICVYKAVILNAHLIRPMISS